MSFLKFRPPRTTRRLLPTPIIRISFSKRSFTSTHAAFADASSTLGADSSASTSTSSSSGKESSSGNNEPAAAVPNSPSPFQLTPELLKQEKVNKEVTRVPLNKRSYTPQTLLQAFGRSITTKLPDTDQLSWEELFRLNNQKLDKMGMNVKDRRYLLWCLEKFRQGEDPKVYSAEERPKKTERGWGPPVRKKPASS